MVSFFKKSVALGLFAASVGLLGVSGNVFAQQKSSFKVSGPCIACGNARIESIAKGLDGVNSATYNPATAMLSLDFNPVSASLVDIQLELSLQGYDAGDFKHDAKAKLPACAGGGMRGDQAADDLPEPGIDDIDGLEKDTDWENPDALNIANNNAVDDGGDIDLLKDEDDLVKDTDLSAWGDDVSADDEFGDATDDDDDL